MPLRALLSVLLRPLARALFPATGRHREATADGYEAWLTETFAR